MAGLIIINGRPMELGDDEEMERRRPRRCSVQVAVAAAAAVVRSLKESSTYLVNYSQPTRNSVHSRVLVRHEDPLSISSRVERFPATAAVVTVYTNRPSLFVESKTKYTIRKKSISSFFSTLWRHSSDKKKKINQI